MAIVKDTISNLVGGVSQQPAKIMYPNQCQELNNYLLSISEGLKKRPPMEHISKIMDVQNTHPVIYTVIKEDEKYIVVLTGTDIKVFDFDGTERTVNMDTTTRETLLSYITSINPLKNLEVTTIGDYTFILNKNIEAELSNDLSPNGYGEAALIFVRQADFGVKYTIKINSSTFTYTVPACISTENSTRTDELTIGTTTMNNSVASTDKIATELYSDITSSLGTTNWQFSRVGSTILIKNKNNTAFTITATDSNGNNNLSAYYKEAESIQLLPTVAPDGYILKIVGEQQDNTDDYYIKFKTSDGSTFGHGTWKECCAPNIKYKINSNTMPHALVREADNTFTYKVLDWADRRAGDEESAPSPSFIGNTIDEVFTHKGRLGILSKDKSILSDTEDIFSFFKATAMAELDTDPIDIMSNSKMVNLKHSLPFNQELLVFSPTAQFSVQGGDVFSNRTVTIDLAMNYPCSTFCKPINLGATGLFVYENGEYSRVKEIYTTSTYNLDARDVTDQCPNYLPKNIFKMTGSGACNLTCFLSIQAPDTVFVYNYYYNSEQKAQSAWSKWIFDKGKVLNIDFDENFLYLIIQYTDGIYLNRMNFSPKEKEPNLDYLFYLDRKAYITNTTVNGEYTTVNLPYPKVNDLIVLNSKGFPLEYEYLGNKLRVEGQHNYLIIGNPYESLWKLGHIYYRQQLQSGGIKTVEGLLMLKDVNISYANAGYFKVRVTPKYTTAIPSTFEFTGKITGMPSSILDQIPVSDGSYLIPIISKNDDIEIEIINDSYLPSDFLSLEWLGDFVIHGQ